MILFDSKSRQRHARSPQKTGKPLETKTNKELLVMNQETKDHSTDQGTKPHVKDLDTKKDVKGGGQKPQSPGTGKDNITPLPPSTQGS